MMKKNAAFLVSILTLLFTLAIPQTLFAAPSQVSVTLPSFNVSLNGIKIDNAYRQYPLIVYKDITYFPMTYNDSRFLGVETTWDSNNGLAINQTRVAAAYRDVRGMFVNKKTQTATIRTGDLHLNGKVIRDADQGQYPFLSFRNVTYFPLTWSYAVKELGWSYHFDSKTGLAVSSTNPKVTKAASMPGTTADGATLYQGYKYAIGKDGAVVSSKVGTIGKSVTLTQLPIWSEGDGKSRVTGSLYVQDGSLWLSYHQGGAIMGHDEYFRLNEKGKFELAESGYLTFRTFGDTKIKVRQGFPPSPNNLSVAIGTQEAKPAGDPAYVYGETMKALANGGSTGSSSRDLSLIDHDLYVLAYNMEKDTDFSRLHKINLVTNETTRVSDLEATGFAIIGNNVYLNSDGDLYRFSLEGGPEEHLNPESKLASVTEDDGYVLCTFVKEANTPYTLVVYDLNGNIVFKTSDVVSSSAVEGGKVYYTEKEGHNVYSASLK
ncbi:hypothetical protein [Cohnella candidum]|uniref:DUF5050 domain-containing protein n=1 Tax=Cohnella candidum TaxID=2674991 RepID=A0A3G3K2V9_9BACL|nr:hypothetical protein [Cohnella candidum]AYQ74885.1 hypothetical protein EAV92_21420 [Cohnella candidum]